MAPAADDIEAPFIPSDWIGKKNDFTSDLPVAVIAAKNAAYKLPAHAMEMMLPGKLPVIQFAELALPRTSSEFVYGEGQLCIPPTAVLNLLSRKSDRAWLNGKKSIADPRFNDGADRFPLWTLTFWIEMSAVIQQQAGWKRSIQWLDNERRKSQDNDTKHFIDRARAELVTTGVNVPLTSGRQSISTLDLRGVPRHGLA
ncbi:hypothetical protein B0H14DRAFT_3437024 [Mycena olivaceomarginata]|nr:hypothetical protein B0H14DRAFT_3437024 [Mycena olivaceomarginata]